MGKFLVEATVNGTIDYEAFAKTWNDTADGKSRYYVTKEILVNYGKAWAKVNNARTSKDLISEQIDAVNRTGTIFAASHIPFPDFLAGTTSATVPPQGHAAETQQTLSCSLAPAISRPLTLVRPTLTIRRTFTTTQLSD